MRLRPAVVVLAGGVALAVGTPAVWAGTRPATAAGPPLATVLGAPVAPAPVVPGPAGPAGHPADPAPPPDVVPPARLVVADAGVDAPVDPVGVTRDGLMELPADVRRVGWYRFGPAPGQPVGSAVLAGHVDSWDQGIGALGRLRTVGPGEQVQVTDAAGVTTHWQVVTRRLVVKQELPLQELFTRGGPPRLVLLTCGGPFDQQARSYRDNLVVVAEPVA